MLVVMKQVVLSNLSSDFLCHSPCSPCNMTLMVFPIWRLEENVCIPFSGIWKGLWFTYGQWNIVEVISV